MIERIAGQIAVGGTDLRRRSVRAEAGRILEREAPWASTSPHEIADLVLGLGPIDRLLRDETVTDVLVNAPDEIWVERDGELQRTPDSFPSSESIQVAVERVIAPLGLRIDRASPFVDARLPDGSRLHAVVPPAVVGSPIIAVRRFTQAVSSLDELVERRSATRAQADQMAELVSKRETILISGGTGTGKTTLLNVLSAYIPRGERIVTIEDAAELRIHGHVVRLEAHPANPEGAGEITIRSLLRSALRLRPDRIIVGEVRGPEALDLVSALNTGHRGSMSTIHANSPDEAMWRLETLALSAGDASPRAVSRQMSSAIAAVVQLERVGSSRVIRDVARVTP